MKVNYFILLLILLTPLISFSAPRLPHYIYNPTTGDCAQVHSGDEFSLTKIKDLTDDWEFLSFDEQADYCENYIPFHDLDFELLLIPLKNPQACTAGFPGSPGDCSDVIINHLQQKCAFVEDVNNCPRLPNNWQETSSPRPCPADYQWLEEYLVCQTDQENNKEESNIIFSEFFHIILTNLKLILASILN